MNIIRKINGFSIIEVLIVAGVMAIVIVIAGVMSSKIYSRRSVDNVTRNISTSLQIAKLKAARQGVEYRTVFAKCTDLDESDPGCPVCETYVNYSAGDKTITISTERGDSNKDSTNWCVETSQEVKIRKGVILNFKPSTLNPYRYSFNPNGTGSSGSVVVQPTAEADTRKCGRIVLSTIGRIRIIEGNWNPDLPTRPEDERCKAIR
jgi:Tfp pilus assembly protein FimT